jgi:hypothetical protein
MSSASPALLVHEIKHVMPAAAAGPAEAWLGAVCRPERERPPAWVVSVYFDTPDLQLLDEKVNSDYLKVKVRVRWYQSLSGSTGEPAFLEVKRRIGTRRDKQRTPLGVPAGALARWRLEDPRWRTLIGQAAPSVGSGLRPSLKLRYVRSRFLDVSGARLALDRRIEVAALHAALSSGPLRADVGQAVVEWKGMSADLPFHLRAITGFGARRQSFSKYQAAAQAAGLT